MSCRARRSVGIASYAFLLAARLVGIFILPAQVPGDPVGLIEACSPRCSNGSALTAAASRRELLLQLVRLEKFTLPEDSQLVRLHTMRQRYLAAGWEATSVTTLRRARLHGKPRAHRRPRSPSRASSSSSAATSKSTRTGCRTLTRTRARRASASSPSTSAASGAARARCAARPTCSPTCTRASTPCSRAACGRRTSASTASRSAAPPRRSRSRRASSRASPSSATARSARLPHTIYGMVRGLPPSGALEAAAPRADDNGGGADDGEGA